MNAQKKLKVLSARYKAAKEIRRRIAEAPDRAEWYWQTFEDYVAYFLGTTNA